MRENAQKGRINGVLAPVLTPFDADLNPDKNRFLQHCQWLLENRTGLAIFGTNSEASSLSFSERIELTEFLLSEGVDPARMMPGTGCCSVTETAELSRHATQAGAAGVLVLPPYYFKNVSEDGLFAYYSELIERVGDARLRVYLYHFPAMSQVPISISLIARLLKRYPDTVAGAKDSSGDLDNALTMVREFAADGFDVFPGNELHLLSLMREGAAGCISATANVNPAGISSLYDNGATPQAEDLQEKVRAVRTVVQQYPMIPAMKRLIASWRDDETWTHVRPPLTQISDDDFQRMVQALQNTDIALTHEHAGQQP